MAAAATRRHRRRCWRQNNSRLVASAQVSKRLFLPQLLWQPPTTNKPSNQQTNLQWKLFCLPPVLVNARGENLKQKLGPNARPSLAVPTFRFHGKQRGEDNKKKSEQLAAPIFWLLSSPPTIDQPLVALTSG